MTSPTVDRRLGLVGNVAIKAPVTVVATTNITLSGQQTIDGVAVLAVNSSGVADRVLCTAQTNSANNGIYDVSTGSWTRSPDADGNYDLASGTMVLASQGTTYAGTVWKLLTSGAITIGTTAQTWSRALTSDLASLSFTNTGTGAVPRDAQSRMRDTISILDFIPVAQHAAILAGTSTYDCSTALANAIASVSMPGLGLLILTGGPEIYFPPGQYSFATTQHIKKRVRLRGVYGASSGAWGTVLKFPADVGGFVFHKDNTDSTGTVASTIGADGSIMEGFNIYGTSRTGVNANAHGIWLRTRVTIKDVEVGTFHGNGINIEAAAGAGGFLEGNANNFQIIQCAGRACGGHGLYVHGADSNAGVVIGFNGEQNLGYGIYDSSFLGNTYLACHSASNTLGSYKSDNANARNLFLGCYAETGQPAGNIMDPAMSIGGLQGPGWDAASTGVRLDATAGVMSVEGGVQMDTLRLGLNAGIGSTLGVLTRFKSTDDVADWTFVRATGRIGYQWANSGTPTHFQFYDRFATPANGYARDLSAGNGSIGIGPYYFGTSTEMKSRSLGTAAPVAGAWLQGDIVDNKTPSEAGIAGSKYVVKGWVCTVAGSPGTWLEMRVLTGN